MKKGGQGQYNLGKGCEEKERKDVEDEDKIKKALLKKALGYNASETVEEYSFSDGEPVLSKRKVTSKHYSPDISAVKLLLERYYRTYEDKVLSMSDDELLKEEERLLKLLKKERKGGDK